MTMSQLFGVFTVHCFFGHCQHTVSGPDPADNHSRMEEHYRAKHASEIAALTVTGSLSADIYVEEGWWHPNVKSGQVHDHPARPNLGWSEASHRLCEPVYTRRTHT